MINVSIHTFNAFQQNTSVVSDESGNCVIIDPGCYSSHEENELTQFIESSGFKPRAVLNTHAHIDHVLGNQFVSSKYDIPLYLHRDDLSTLRSVENYAHLYGFEGYKKSPEPTFFLEDGQVLTFGNICFKVMHTPGHAPGHVVFIDTANNFVINGDVLFRGSFGRTDLPGGDFETLKSIILNKMFSLPEDMTIYCGHGPSTTIGTEKVSNYILNF
jgi:hydroxyacylglutathione hydrolase